MQKYGELDLEIPKSIDGLFFSYDEPLLTQTCFDSLMAVQPNVTIKEIHVICRIGAATVSYLIYFQVWCIGNSFCK